MQKKRKHNLDGEKKNRTKMRKNNLDGSHGEKNVDKKKKKRSVTVILNKKITLIPIIIEISFIKKKN